MPAIKFPGSQATDAELVSQLRKWEQTVLEEVRKFHSGNDRVLGALKFRTTVPLELLPLDMRSKLMNEYREIIGFNDFVLDTAGQGVMGSGKARAEGIAGRNDIFNWVKGLNTRNPYANVKMDLSGQLNTKAFIYNALNVNFGPPRYELYDNEAYWFHIGTQNIPTVDTLQANMQKAQALRDRTPIMSPGAKYTVFDIETGGLGYGQIREVAWQQGVVGAGNEMISSGGTPPLAFRSALFARGVVADAGGKPETLENRILRTQGIDVTGMKYGDGADYANRMFGFLKQLDESDHVIGHNISRFDLNQIFVGLSGTSAYRNNQIINGVNFREFVDRVYGGLQAKMIDTLDMARAMDNLAGIEVAKELGLDGTRYSIENLLLQTDLARYLDPETLKQITGGGGLHLGTVDTAVTHALANYLPKLKLGRVVDHKMVAAVVKSKALTPMTKIADPADITDKMWDIIERNGGSGLVDKDGNPLGNIGRKNFAKIKRDIKRGARHDIGFDITPLQQEMALSRRAISGMPRPGGNLPTGPQATMNIGIFDRYTGRTIPYQGILQKKNWRAMSRTGWSRPTIDEWAKFQDRLAAAGIPYAGLSYEERRFGTALAALTSHLAPNTHAALYGADAMVSHFYGFSAATDDIQFINQSLGRGRALTLPTVMLHNLGLLKGASSAEPTVLGISAFETPTGNSAVNLVYNFRNQNEITLVKNELVNLANKSDSEIAKALGMTPGTEQAKKIVARFRNSLDDMLTYLDSSEALKYGVTTGQLYGGKATDAVVALMRDISGGRLADDETVRWGLTLGDIQGLGSEDVAPTIRTGAPYMDQFGAEGAKLADETRYALSYVDEVMGKRVTGVKSLAAAARVIATKAGDDASVARAMAWQNLYETKIRPRTKPALAVGSLMAAGYYIYNRKRRQDKFDVALDRMPVQNVSNYMLDEQVAERIASGTGTSASRMDPLATASIVSDLHNTRVNHTNMRWDKNTALYGGLL